MIVINKGHTYGKRENGKVIPITFKDGPTALDDAEETRLVALGVAHFVLADNDETIKENPDDGLKKVEDEKPLKNYSIKELKVLAKSKGIDIPKDCTKKADIIALIEQAAGSPEETGEDNESNGDAPSIKTQLPE